MSAPAAPPASKVIEAPITALNTSAGSVAPSSAGEIHVVPQPVTPAAAPKPGSAKDRMFAALRAKGSSGSLGAPAQVATAPVAPAVPPNPPPTAAPAEPVEEAEPVPEAEAADLGDDTSEPSATAAPTPKPTSATPSEPSATPADGKPKVSPWKLVDEYKDRVRKSEQEVLELKKLVPNEAARKQELAELENIRKRNEELEKAIARVDFTKSKEFQEKVEKPYTEAWQQAAQEIAEITVVDDMGNERAATTDDLMRLCNLPLGQARAEAKEKFGEFADDVMAHRKAITDLYQARQRAIKEQSALTAEQQKEHEAKVMKLRTEITNEVTTSWQHYNDLIAKDKNHGKYFAPDPADQVGSEKLTKGYALVDKAFAMNPLDPRLTPDQRKEAVRLQAAVRNRAAAYGRLTHLVSAKDARIAALEAKLKQYESSEPEVAGSTAPPTPAGTSARSSVISALHKLAK